VTLFQLILLGATAFFAWQIYKFVSGLRDDAPNLPSESESPRARAEAAQKRVEQPTPAPVEGNDVNALLAKADNAYADNNLTDARVYLERAEKHDPDNPEVLNKLAFVLFKHGENEEALRKYERSLAIDPGDDLTHNAAAEVLRKLGRYDEAQEHYKAAVDIDENFAETYFNYGELLREKNDIDGARMMFEKALELDPDYAEAKTALEQLK
jgi:Tfp pilus assembly protein PilF